MTSMLASAQPSLNDAIAESQQPLSATLQACGLDFKQMLLNNFRDEMADHFPFLAHGPLREYSATTSLDASTCEEKAPFTMAAVFMSALHRHCVLQKRVSQELLASLVSAMLLQGKKSLDLLFCILVVSAWYPFHVTRNPQMMNLLHLARALMVDLGLTLGADGLPSRLWADVTHLLFGRNSGPHDLTAESRAIMGVYYVGAYYAVTLRRSDFPGWHESLERSCHHLEESGSSSIDTQALYATRLLQTAERYLTPGGIRPSQTMTVRAYVSCFSSDIKKFRASIPESLSNNSRFQLDIQCIEIALYDRIVASAGAHHAETAEALHTLLALIASYIDSFIAIPDHEFPSKTSISKAQISQALEVLAKLSVLTGIPGWDMHYVRRHNNFSQAVDRLVEKFEQVFLAEKERYPDMEASQFAIYPIKLRQRKRWYEEAIAKEMQDTTMTSTLSVNGAAGPGAGGVASGWEAIDDFLQWNYPIEDFSWT